MNFWGKRIIVYNLLKQNKHISSLIHDFTETCDLIDHNDSDINLEKDIWELSCNNV
jgi:hypothetical protein